MSIIAVGSASSIKLMAAAAITCGFPTIEQKPFDDQVALHVEGATFERVQCLFTWAQQHRPPDVDLGFRGSVAQ